MNDLERRGNFCRIYQCSSCGTVLADGPIEETYWLTRKRRIQAWVFGLISFGVLLLPLFERNPNGKPPKFDRPPSFLICPRCGADNDKLEMKFAAWVSTSHWFLPWTWGRGSWLLREDFQRLLTGEDEKPEGGELTLMKGGKRKSV